MLKDKSNKTDTTLDCELTMEEIKTLYKNDPDKMNSMLGDDPMFMDLNDDIDLDQLSPED